MNKYITLLVIFLLNFFSACDKYNLNRTNQLDPQSKNFIPIFKVTDIDGNVYDTVKIGSQVWLKQNLRTTRLNNGDLIPNVNDNQEWSNLSSSAYSWYNNDPVTFKIPYGAYYNWFTVNTGRLCPIGWHIPSKNEWNTLTTFLGGSVAGGKLKEADTIYWRSPNISATNEGRFTAVGCGLRSDDGSFRYIKLFEFFWLVNEYDITNAWSTDIGYDGGDVRGPQPNRKQFGFSVRCLKDN